MLAHKVLALTPASTTSLEQQIWFKFGKKLDAKIIEKKPELKALSSRAYLYPLAFAESVLAHYIPQFLVALETKTIAQSVYLERLHRITGIYKCNIPPLIYAHIHDALYNTRVAHANQPLLITTDAAEQNKLALYGAIFIEEILNLPNP